MIKPSRLSYINKKEKKKRRKKRDQEKLNDKKYKITYSQLVDFLESLIEL